MELGPLGMEPWGNIELAAPASNLYPDIEFLGQLLDERGVTPDFAYSTKDASRSLRFIHKSMDGAEVYFVANKTPRVQEAVCAFRVRGKRPELWRPVTGEILRPAVYDEVDGRVRVPMRLEPNESVFVVFRAKAGIERDRIVSVTRNGEPVLDTKVAATATDAGARAGAGCVDLVRGANGHVSALVWQSGRYAFKTANGSGGEFESATLPTPFEIAGPWQVEFAPGGGAPNRVTFEKLIPWNDHADLGVRYFSGTAAYTKAFTMPPELMGKNQRLFLDLGHVAVVAEVRLNGRVLGTLWNTPFRVEVTDALNSGQNLLDVRVVNLWVNRQIGDEMLPEDSDRNPSGTLKKWPQWLEEGKPSPTGRYTFTSWRLWKKDSPLQESGLLGPVTITAAKEISRVAR